MTKQENNTSEIENEKDIEVGTHNDEQLNADSNAANLQQKHVDEKEKRIAELEDELKIAKKNESEAMLRARAEIENNRRRMEQEVNKANKFALEKFSNELLSVIDNLERALDAIDKENPAFEITIQGLELTLQTFLNTIKKFGIEQINPENEILNPELHQAIKVANSPEHKSGHVINAIQKGYTLNGRLLRPAMVVVAK